MSTHMFSWRTIENYPLIITTHPPDLFHCKVAVAVTDQLIKHHDRHLIFIKFSGFSDNKR